MKKIALLILILLFSCQDRESKIEFLEKKLEQIRNDIQEFDGLHSKQKAIKQALADEVDALSKQRKKLRKDVSHLTAKMEGKRFVHILKLKIYQSRISFSLIDHAKDAANAFTLEIPVDENYYKEMNVGDMMADEKRMGSILLKGSFSSWKIKVVGKRVEVL